MAPHLVEHHRVHLAVFLIAGPHDHIGDSGVYDHLRAEKAWPDLGERSGFDIEPGKVERASPRQFSCLEQGIHLSMYTPATLVVGAGGDVVVFSPAAVEFCTVHLLSGGSRVTGRDDRIIFIHNDRAEVPAEAGSLVGAPQGKVEKIFVTIGSHLQEFWEAG